MRVVTVGIRGVPNLRFSRDSSRYGSPPGEVRIGGIVRVVFEDPGQLIKGGVSCDPGVASMLIRNFPGFKRIVNRRV